MKKTAVKLDLDVLRGLAKSRAMLLAENSGINPDTIRHMVDTDFNQPCFVVIEGEDRAVVVYDHEPDVKHSIINRPGRLTKKSETEEVK